MLPHETIQSTLKATVVLTIYHQIIPFAKCKYIFIQREYKEFY